MKYSELNSLDAVFNPEPVFDKPHLSETQNLIIKILFSAVLIIWTAVFFLIYFFPEYKVRFSNLNYNFFLFFIIIPFLWTRCPDFSKASKKLFYIFLVLAAIRFFYLDYEIKPVEFAAEIMIILALFLCFNFFTYFYALQKKYNLSSIFENAGFYSANSKHLNDIIEKRSILEDNANLIISVFEVSKDLQRQTSMENFKESLTSGLIKNFDFDYASLIFFENLKNKDFYFYKNQTPESAGYPDNNIESLLNSDFYKSLSDKNHVIAFSKKTGEFVCDIEQPDIDSIFIPLYDKSSQSGIMHIAKSLSFFSPFEIGCFKMIGFQISRIIYKLKLKSEINSLIISDGLTKLFVQKYFKKKLEDELERSKSGNNFFSLIMCDIDHFKKINDVYGHQAGDEVLKNTSDIFLKTIRSVDFAARYGGDEFALILPQTDKNGAVILAERLRKKIENAKIPFHDKHISIAISLGVATYRKSNAGIFNADDIIKLADGALYHSKKSGRNCVTTVD